MITNPWQTWLNSLTQQPGTQWEKSLGQWQSNMENIWSSPASYWQAVSSIQSARARSLAQFWQQQPQYFAGLFQCTTFPQLVEHMGRWHNATLSSMMNINMVTQAHRGNLMQQWQRQFSFMSAKNTSLQSMWKSSTRQITQAQSITPFQMPIMQKQEAPQAPKPQAPVEATTTTVAPKPEAKAEIKPEPILEAKPEPKAEIKTEPKIELRIEPKIEAKPEPLPQPEAKAEPKQEIAAAAKPTQATVTQIQTPQDQLHLLNGTNGSPIASQSTTPMPTHIMSSTATSVMRSGTGSTIASAAAARRSVVARRASGRRRAPR